MKTRTRKTQSQINKKSLSRGVYTTDQEALEGSREVFEEGAEPGEIEAPATLAGPGEGSKKRGAIT